MPMPGRRTRPGIAHFVPLRHLVGKYHGAARPLWTSSRDARYYVTTRK
jgi:hypothetical protein